MKKNLEKVESGALFEELRTLIDDTRTGVATAVNTAHVRLFWQIGRRINQDVLGEERATYGGQIVVTLSRQLTAEFGRSYEEKNLRRMMQFAQLFPDEQIVATLSRQLSWSHFVALLPIKTEIERHFLSDKGAKLLNRILLPANAVCVSCIGWQMGEVVLTSIQSFTNQQINSIITNEKVDPLFLFCTFRPRKQERLSIGSATGVRTPILNKSGFCNLAVQLPPLPTQRRIASILSTYDDLIENNNKRIKILEEMARMLYREWFVHFRFPGHEKARMVDSEVGRIPEGWGVVAFGDMADVNKFSIKKGKAPERINYIDIKAVSTGSVDNIEEMRFADAPGRARQIVKAGDTIWSTVRPNRRSFALIHEPLKDSIVSTGFAVLTPKKCPSTYLYLATTNDGFTAFLVNRARDAAYSAVTGKDFLAAKLVVPEEAFLRKFDNIVEPMLRLSSKLKAKNGNLRQTRDLLLPGLISGEIDVAFSARERTV